MDDAGRERGRERYEAACEPDYCEQGRERDRLRVTAREANPRERRVGANLGNCCSGLDEFGRHPFFHSGTQLTRCDCAGRTQGRRIGRMPGQGLRRAQRLDISG